LYLPDSVLFFGAAESPPWREIFLFYLFALAPCRVFVFTLADPDVAKIIFRVANYNDDFAGFGVLVDPRGNFPEVLPDLPSGAWRPAAFFFL